MTTSGMQPEWCTEHMIRSYEVDPQATARLPVLCQFMQEAAYFHAEHLGVGHSHLSQFNTTWVLARMRIEVSQLPGWGDVVRLRTWPSGRDRLFYYRDFEMIDANGDLVLQASTAWFVIDTEKRERSIPEWWLTADYPSGPKNFDAKLNRLKGCGAEDGESFKVNYGDLDQNGHVNNVRYIEWVFSSLSKEFHQTHRIQSLEVNYLAEAVCGHTVSICSRETDPLQFSHGIMTDGADLFRAQTIWTG